VSSTLAGGRLSPSRFMTRANAATCSNSAHGLSACSPASSNVSRSSLRLVAVGAEELARQIVGGFNLCRHLRGLRALRLQDGRALL